MSVDDVNRTSDDQTEAAPNAFISFKRFIDSSWDGLTLGGRRRTIQDAELRHKQRAWFRWTGQSDDAEPNCTRSEATQATGQLFRLAELRTLDIPSPLVAALLQDGEGGATDGDLADAMLAFGGACYFLPEIGDRLPSSAALFRPAARPPRWLTFDWFKQSPYSPVQLEALEDLSGPSARWRAAFTDLMAISLGRAVPPSNSAQGSLVNQLNNPESCPGIDWVLRLQLHGILPPLLPSTNAGNQGFQRPSREYNRWFSQAIDEIWRSNRATALSRDCLKELQSFNSLPIQQTIGNPSFDGNADDIDVKLEPSINVKTFKERSDPATTVGHGKDAAEILPADLQTDSRHGLQSAVLFTTQATKSTRSLDGAFIARTLVKRRYEDGREEEWETVHTTNNPEH